MARAFPSTETTEQSLLAHRVTRLEQELKTIAHGLKLLNSANSLQTGFNNAVIRDVALGNKQVQQITEDVSTLQKCVEDLYEAGNYEDDVEEGSEDYDYNYDYDDYSDDDWYAFSLESVGVDPSDGSSYVDFSTSSIPAPLNEGVSGNLVNTEPDANKDMQDDYAPNQDIWTREVVHLILHG